MKRILSISLLMLCIIPISLGAWTNWHTLSTNSFKVFYQSGMESEAMSAIQTLEHYRPYVESLTGNTQSQTAIKIEDIGNLVNGYANPIGNQIALFRYPPTGDEMAVCDDWTQMVATHEYIHMLQMTNDSGVPQLLRQIFGNLLYVQLHQPMWMTEGITVYGESQLSPTAGRLNGGYYTSIISALAKEGRLPSLTKAGYYSSDTPLAHYYVFGGSFHSYLARTYGEEKFAWLYHDNSSRVESYTNGVMPSLSLNGAFARTYGKPLEVLWQDWQNSEKAKPYQMPQQRLSYDGWNKSELKSYNDKLYYIAGKADKTGPGARFYHNGIVRRDPITNRSRFLIRQSTEFPAGFHIANNRLYYSRNQVQRGFANNENDGYGYVTEILSADMNGNGSKLLCKGLIRAFYPLPDGSLLLAEDKPDYQSSIIKRYDPITKKVSEQFSTSKLVHGIFADGDRIFVNARDYWKNSSIFRLDIAAGKLIPIIDTPSWEAMTGINGDTISFSAVYDGNTGSYQYNLSSGKCSRFADISDIRTPVQTSQGNSYFLSVNGDGLDIYADNLNLKPFTIPQNEYREPPYKQIAYSGNAANPLLHSPTAKTDASPASSVWDEAISTYSIRKGTYADNVKHMLMPRMLRLPIIEGTSDSLSIGAVLVGNDVVGDFPQWQLMGYYDTFQSKTFVEFALQNSFFRPLHQQIQIANTDGGSFTLNQYTTLFQREHYGLNSVLGGFSFSAQDSYKRKIVSPYLSQGLSWQTGKLRLYNSLIWEDKETLSSNRNRLGWQGQLSLRQQSTTHSELNSTVNIAYDPDADSDEVFYPLRGYADELPGNQGITARSTWYHPIFKVREGNWSPQIYLEDISGGVFFDAALPRYNTEANAQYSYGVELIAEVGAAFYGMMNIGVRAGYDRDGNSFISMILGTGF
jgi:hypothetical protein